MQLGKQSYTVKNYQLVFHYDKLECFSLSIHIGLAKLAGIVWAYPNEADTCSFKLKRIFDSNETV